MSKLSNEVADNLMHLLSAIDISNKGSLPHI